MDDYQDRCRETLRRLPVAPPPVPWRKQGVFRIGGLTEIGFAPDSDQLLVLSHNGRGLFDCITGQRLGRDREPTWEGLDEVRLRSPGLGDLEDIMIRIAGLHGGGLPRTTSDGWGLEVVSLPWPDHLIFLYRIEQSHRFEDWIRIGDDGGCTFRAAGFSETGRSLVIATSCDLITFTRTENSG